MKLLETEKLSLTFKKKIILRNINFILKKGEIISIIGPSGAGKSSLLRVIAGLTYPSQGKIKMNNELISSSKEIIPTGKRNIGMMFQEEVLFPHLSVYQNIGFGLSNKKVDDKKKLILNYIRNFGLSGKENIYPSNLSGGEKQRVSLARILITNPKILLMDEPYSNLDFGLRNEISDFTIKILKKKNMSVIIVTHDIKEALRISDKIIVMKDGNILQIDTPEMIYRSPKSKYVATLLGDINQFQSKSNTKGEVKTPFGIVNCKNCNIKTNNCVNAQHFCLFRPEDIYFSDQGTEAEIVNRCFLGSSWEYTIYFNKTYPLIKLSPCKQSLNIGQKIQINIHPKSILIFDK